MWEQDLLRLEALLGRSLGADARRAGVREATARVLLALGEGTPRSMGAIAERIGRDPTTTTRFVDRAVAEGLVLRHPGTHDRRVRMVELTPQGEVARRALLKAWQERAARLGARLLARTGMVEGQSEWFLGELLRAAEAERGEGSGPGALPGP